MSAESRESDACNLHVTAPVHRVRCMRLAMQPVGAAKHGHGCPPGVRASCCARHAPRRPQLKPGCWTPQSVTLPFAPHRRNQEVHGDTDAGYEPITCHRHFHATIPGAAYSPMHALHRMKIMNPDKCNREQESGSEAHCATLTTSQIRVLPG